ncbi:polyprenyl synthetase family protein [Cognatiluteimonas lumbrici]|uniref:polyprenyl synthetase family protein n=1 Tax=Cognatiluteimonas lumbrici TaxID=2559601 RepID=UPI001128C14B|nr:polyprenyl synthetase family protein [Luteimonas lumbrici]
MDNATAPRPPEAGPTRDRAALDLSAIQALAAGDMARVDALVRRRLASDVVLINQVAEHIVAAGGKRLRPMLLLLAAAACGKRDAGGDGVGADAHQLAAVIEFIHTSTLLHDDVVDESDLRRGRSTANAVWGNAASVLVGDFLYSRSFQLMVELDSMEVQRILADTTNRIAEGEVLQLLHVRNPDTDEDAYLRVIERKTAVLFAAATRLGGVLAGADAATCDALHDYGLNLGYAFQIADDVLDYSADEATLGKHLGDDLAEGKATLPLIHAMAHADEAVRALLRRAIEEGDASAMPTVLEAIAAARSLDYSLARAHDYAEAAEAALDGLEDGPHVAALRGLARYAISRDR